MQSINTTILLVLLALTSLSASDHAIDAEQPGLLPLPQSIQWSKKAIPVKEVAISFSKKVQQNLRENPLLAAQLSKEIDELFRRNKIAKSENADLQLVFDLREMDAPFQKEEGYHLVVEERGVALSASTVKGLYYGLQTLRQLTVCKDGKTTMAACSITDYPAFKVRGFMHDVGRNFQSIDQLKMQVNLLAHYKINVFHWHLTDHFGWRLESKKIPNLQADSSFGRGVGKFYTQKEFKEMVDYCWARGVIIIPEFDSPGHSEAFRHGLGIQNMKDPRAKEAMVTLIDELCTLADKTRMPYIHIGTDEVRHADEQVDDDFLPALHNAVKKNGREVMGWWKGMTLKGDTEQIQQSWAQYKPLKTLRHIDSRSNYLNHLEALDFASRMHFQQPCRVPHGNDQHLGGIIAHWPDTRVANEKLTLTNNPVLPAIVAYSEAVWKGIEKDRPEYWASLPAKGTAAYLTFADFENRLAEQRDRFMQGLPFPMVKTHEMEWRLLGPVAPGEVPELDQGTVKDIYQFDGKIYRWTKPVQGAAIHTRHFFGFQSHYQNHPKGKPIVWANTYLYSPIEQEVDAWIAFNTLSSSDDRSGAPVVNQWHANKECDIWINDQRIAPPTWKNPANRGKEIPLIDEIYSSRAPTKIHLVAGWNKILVRSAHHWKWVFSFSPLIQDEFGVREVPALKYSATLPLQHELSP